MYRVLSRIVKTKAVIEIRTDMADGCKEKWFDREFISFVWNFNKKNRPGLYRILNEMKLSENELLIFKSRKEVSRFINFIYK